MATVNGRIRCVRKRWSGGVEGSDCPVDRLVDAAEQTVSVGVRQLAIDRFRFVPSEEGPDRIVVTGPTHTPQPLPSGAESEQPEPPSAL